MSIILKQNTAITQEWVNSTEAAKLLGISTKTLTNYVCSEKIPPRAIRVGCTGKKFFNVNILIGLSN